MLRALLFSAILGLPAASAADEPGSRGPESIGGASGIGSGATSGTSGGATFGGSAPR
jgi:hypothetical protein